MPVLTKEAIRQLIEQKPSLIEGYLDLDTQLQPNGFDLTLREIAWPRAAGRLDFDNSERIVPLLTPLAFDGRDFIHLAPGAYVITYNEAVRLPRDVMALAWPRSSLLRAAATVHNAVWDAGYAGRSQSLLTVHNPHGLDLKRNARVVQMVFFRLSGTTDGYRGIYQGENLT